MHSLLGVEWSSFCFLIGLYCSIKNANACCCRVIDDGQAHIVRFLSLPRVQPLLVDQEEDRGYRERGALPATREQEEADERPFCFFFYVSLLLLALLLSLPRFLREKKNGKK